MRPGQLKVLSSLPLSFCHMSPLPLIPTISPAPPFFFFPHPNPLQSLVCTCTHFFVALFRRLCNKKKVPSYLLVSLHDITCNRCPCICILTFLRFFARHCRVDDICFSSFFSSLAPGQKKVLRTHPRPCCHLCPLAHIPPCPPASILSLLPCPNPFHFHACTFKLDIFACFLGFATLIFCLPVGRAASLEF